MISPTALLLRPARPAVRPPRHARSKASGCGCRWRGPAAAPRRRHAPLLPPAATPPTAADAAAAVYGWNVARAPTPVTAEDTATLSSDARAAGPIVVDLDPRTIRRPLGRSRTNDAAKVDALMLSIASVGQLDPIDVLECEGQMWGFSGCHRFEAVTRLGLPTVRCRVRRVTPAVLRMHLR